jgi:hypothetical protein
MVVHGGYTQWLHTVVVHSGYTWWLYTVVTRIATYHDQSNVKANIQANIQMGLLMRGGAHLE